MICIRPSKVLFMGKPISWYSAFLLCTSNSNFTHALLLLQSCSFIFLFRWTEERRARRKVVENAAEIFVKDEEKVNSIFFAQQVGTFYVCSCMVFDSF